MRGTDDHAPTRVVIGHVRPEISGGRYPVKRVVGEKVLVEADVFADGHDLLAVLLRYRRAEESDWREVTGSLEYRSEIGEPRTLAILQGFVPNEGDAWRYTLDSLERYFERAVARIGDATNLPLPERPILALVEEKIPPPAHEAIGTYLETARLLGERTAQLHLALVSEPDDPIFSPEPFTPFYQRSLYQSMRNLKAQVFQVLRRSLRDLPAPARAEAQRVLDLDAEILKRFRAVVDRKIGAVRTRIHGDYHLGQVLHTGKDFVIIDFEGEPARPLSERRIKRSPLRDVCGMLRSFHYAVQSALQRRVEAGQARTEDLPRLEPWARLWHGWVSSAFLKKYLRVSGKAAFLPRGRGDLAVLLNAYLLEKAIYELGYELNNRPSWVRVPLQGILNLVEGSR
jgi:maltose alpha-D-glucosyltransferase/alpha-amylase